MKRFKQSYFTLLELLIVLFIISFGVILTGVKVQGIYREQRFLSESQQILSHLVMAQDLMLILDTDVHVKFAQEKEQLTVWMEVEKPIKEAWAKLIEKKHPLSAIQSLEFNENSLQELSLLFSFGKMSQGKLVLFEGKENQGNRGDQRQFEIELPGYPSSLGPPKPNSSEKRTRFEKSELLYPSEVYEKLYADPNKKKSNS